MVLTFKEFRKVKDLLPNGASKQIADKLGIQADTVRNYFGGDHYEEGASVDVHFEKGPNGGYVRLINTQIFEEALSLIKATEAEIGQE